MGRKKKNKRRGYNRSKLPPLRPERTGSVLDSVLRANLAAEVQAMKVAERIAPSPGIQVRIKAPRPNIVSDPIMEAAGIGKPRGAYGATVVAARGYRYTHDISTDAALHLMESDSAFRARVINGDFTYVNGHLCLSSKAYVAVDPMGNIGLTPYAQVNLNECLVKLSIPVYRPRRSVGGSFKTGGGIGGRGRISRSFGGRSGFGSFRVEMPNAIPRSGGIGDIGGTIDVGSSCIDLTSLNKIGDLYTARLELLAFGDDLGGALFYLMTKLGYTEEQLAGTSGISVHKISRLRTRETKSVTDEDALALVIGMHVPPPLGSTFMNIANKNLMSRKGSLYEFIMGTMHMQDRYYVSNFLRSKNYPPIPTNAENK